MLREIRRSLKIKAQSRGLKKLMEFLQLAEGTHGALNALLAPSSADVSGVSLPTLLSTGTVARWGTISAIFNFKGNPTRYCEGRQTWAHRCFYKAEGWSSAATVHEALRARKVDKLHSPNNAAWPGIASPAPATPVRRGKNQKQTSFPKVLLLTTWN